MPTVNRFRLSWALILVLPALNAPALGGEDRAWNDFKDVVGGVTDRFLANSIVDHTGPPPKPEPVLRPDRLPEARLKRYLDKHVTRPVTTFTRKLSDKARDKARARRNAAVDRRTRSARPSS